MTLELIRAMLGWCATMNMGILMFWALFMLGAGDWVYRFHSRFFKIERARFDAIHYGGMALFKIAIFMLNVVPYLALRIVG